MATVLDRQRHSHRRRRISDSALGLQRYLSDQHCTGVRLSQSSARQGRSISLQRDRDADAHLLMRKETFNAQRSTLNIEWLGTREDEAQYEARADQKKTPQFDLEDRLLEFAARLTKLGDALPNSRTANHVAGQRLRCGTSPFANHGEVQAAESRKDFIHKLGVCFKELKEVRRWLRFIARVELVPAKRLCPLLVETEELIRIFSASIRTAEKNAK